MESCCFSKGMPMRHLAFSLTLACILATVSPMRAQAQETGSVTVFYSPSSSDLEAQSLTGKPSFTNDGHYGGAFGDVLLVDRVGVMGESCSAPRTQSPGGRLRHRPSIRRRTRPPVFSTLQAHLHCSRPGRPGWMHRGLFLPVREAGESQRRTATVARRSASARSTSGATGSTSTAT